MGLAQKLGFEDSSEGGSRLAAVAERWDAWAAEDPVLASVGGIDRLRGWTRAAAEYERDGVLLPLARRAARDGGDDEIAAIALTWALLPGACNLAGRLRYLSPYAEELVASNLWIECRTFRWEDGHRVAANILARTRTGVMADVEIRSAVGRTDKTWASSNLVAPGSPFWEDEVLFGRYAVAQSPDGPEAGLVDLIGSACDRQVITPSDGQLLMSLMSTAADLDNRAGRGRGGVMGRQASAIVGREVGMSEASVRRRARSAIHALSAAYERPTGMDRPA